MADDKKKSKIDLKARLGKSSMSGAGGAGVPVPLPVPGAAPGTTPIPDADGAPVAAQAPQRSPSVRPPVGIAPPPGLSPGIPVPPFAQQKQQAAPPKPTAVQQTIKVEESEVIHTERKKAQKKIALYGALAALLGIGMGYLVGGAKANSDVGAKAVRTAGDLEKEVKGSNEKLTELATKLEDASKALQNKQFPDQAITDLGGLVIPFDADQLGNRIGGVAMPTKLVRPLVSYTVKVREVNDSKDKVKNFLSLAKASLEKYWKEEKEPVFNFSVVFAPDGSKGMQAELVPNKEPFPVGKDWPASYTILQTQRTQQGVKQAEKKANRWVKDALTGSDPIAIPVAPASVAAFSSEELISKLFAELRGLRKIIEGNKEDPTDTGGLLKEGQSLADELRKASLAR
jgi:hypothetical protein